MDCPPRVLLGYTALIASGFGYYAKLRAERRAESDNAANATAKPSPGAPNGSLVPRWKLPPISTNILIACSLVTIAPTLAFLADFQLGMRVISFVYPTFQNPAPFLARKERIYTHFLFASTAILIGPFQLWASFRHANPEAHKALGALFSAALGISCLASVSYAAKQSYGPDGGFAGFISFAMMAATAAGYTVKGLLCLSSDSNEAKREHGRAMTRAFLCFLGDGLLFRGLARVYIPLLNKWNGNGGEPKDGFASWVTTIWFSWAIPLVSYEVGEGLWIAWKGWRWDGKLKKK